MTYRLRRAPPHYIADDWSEVQHHQQQQQQQQQQQHQQQLQQQQQQQQHQQKHQATINRRKYIDPWDLENYEYIQRTTLSSPVELQMTPSPAGEPIASTFYYVPASDEAATYDDRQHQQQQHQQQLHLKHLQQLQQQYSGEPDDAAAMDMNAMMMDMMLMDGGGGGDRGDGGGGGGDSVGAERFDYTTGCYAGLDEELFYNAKYESIHDEPTYSMYYTDIETASSNERTSSCGSSSAVSTLQLHTPGFGVRASGRRSIVLPKPEPHIEFPPAPPPHEYYTTQPPGVEPNYNAHRERTATGPKQQRSLYGDAGRSVSTTSYATLPLPNGRSRPTSRTVEHDEPHFVHEGGVAGAGDEDIVDDVTDDQQLAAEHAPNHAQIQHLHAADEAHLPFCSLSNCYACVPEHVPVYAISHPATLMRRRLSAGIGEIGGEIGDGLAVAVPPNNFGLSKRGLLQIDYSFNWSNLYRFISQGH